MRRRALWAILAVVVGPGLCGCGGGGGGSTPTFEVGTWDLAGPEDLGGKLDQADLAPREIEVGPDASDWSDWSDSSGSDELALSDSDGSDTPDELALSDSDGSDVCLPDCKGKKCGDDGCGGSCGECALGEACEEGKCVVFSECEAVGWEGCCEGDLLEYCLNDKPYSVSCVGSPKCGWSSDKGSYDCGTEGDEDPSGEHPKYCPGCQPSCTGKACGSDGCGGMCGLCDLGMMCVAGKCQKSCSSNCDYLGQTACIDALQGYWVCEEVALDCFQWSESIVACPEDTPCNPAVGKCACPPKCAGKECGDDGCGGSCGVCPGLQDKCVEGLCVCLPDCEGKECGDDGCGGSCGVCPGLQDKCVEGLCACLPACLGKECGDDGCGGVCGECAGGPDACLDGKCLCFPSCAGKECGDDGCGGTCGSCEGAQEICVKGQCVCQPACTAKECGPDGCGGVCGAGCGAGKVCLTGKCTGGGSCAALPEVGCCDGEKLAYCASGQLKVLDCTPWPKCGWHKSLGWYECSTDGGEDPGGKWAKECSP